MSLISGWSSLMDVVSNVDCFFFLSHCFHFLRVPLFSSSPYSDSRPVLCLSPSFILFALPSSLPPCATVSVCFAKDSGTSGPSIMHSHNQLLTNLSPSMSHRLVSPLAEPCMSPSMSLSVSALCVCIICVGVRLIVQHQSLHRSPPAGLMLCTRCGQIKSRAHRDLRMGHNDAQLF